MFNAAHWPWTRYYTSFSLLFLFLCHILVQLAICKTRICTLLEINKCKIFTLEANKINLCVLIIILQYVTVHLALCPKLNLSFTSIKWHLLLKNYMDKYSYALQSASLPSGKQRFVLIEGPIWVVIRPLAPGLLLKHWVKSLYARYMQLCLWQNISTQTMSNTRVVVVFLHY